MARKERNNVDYFPHPVSHGKKMFYLRSKFGNNGYSVWFMLLEELGKADYHYLDLSSKIQLMYLSSEFMVTEEMLKDIISLLVEFGEFDQELWTTRSVLYNQKFTDNVSDAYKKRNNECISKGSLYSLLGIPYKPLGISNELIEVIKGDGNPQRKEEEIKEKKTKEEERKENDLDPSEIDFSGVDPDNILINKILKNFNFNEITNIDKMKEAWSFLKCIHLADRVQYFESQMDAYFDYKKLTNGLDFIHSFKNFLGSHDKLFTDGAWNQENWVAKLETEKLTKQNGKANQSNSGRRSHINPPTNSYSKL